MLGMVGMTLTALWLFGVITRNTTGGWNHLPLLMLALVIGWVSAVRSRRLP